ncbi:uncharacterized protein proca1 [Gadus macrocephalus]|uniref:uncharacterized protein proca1 n=1 Tax=Gadus macrocephalus TaxID=80720 RepID=UPI0028CB5F6A|nr:uncharacterized protein proca1 [Gadus macrocephalus]
MLWVLFVFLSYQDRNVVKGKLLNDAHGAENESKDAWFTVNRTLCAKMSMLAGGMEALYQVSDGRRSVRSVVDTRGDLVDCSIIVDRLQVRSFLHLCRLGLTQQDFHSERLSAQNNRFVRMEEALATCRQFTQRSEPRVEPRPHKAPTQPWPSGDERKKRSKRGFTYPGTLWCGAGNMADHDDHLGDFPETDSCCRTHDHCPHVIHAFSSKYGYTNLKWYSICHCDCDIAMKQCLAEVNDTVSRVVGQAFFNVIGAPCFEFVYKDHCVERHWYGVCKRYERLPVAVPQPAVPYIFGGIPVIDVLTAPPPPAKTDTARVNEQATRLEGGTTSEPPSLVTMVTAAEDFIKVLATVSTSQGTPSDATKGLAHSTEEKKTKKEKTKKGKKTKKKEKNNQKNSGKRKKPQNQGKNKGKGRGRKVKSHKDTGVEDVLVASSSKAGVGDHFLIELKAGRSGHGDKNTFVEGGFDLAGHRGASNEVMKDEPALEKDAAEVTLPSSPKERVTRPSELATVSTGSARLAASANTTAATLRKTKALRSRKRERRRKKTPQSESYCPPDNALNMTLKEDSPLSSTARLADTSGPCIVGVNPLTQTGLQRPKGRSESGSFLTTSRTHVIMTEEEMVGRRWRRRRKLASAVPIVSVDHKVCKEESGTEMDSIGAHTIITDIPQTKRQELEVSHRPEMYGTKSTACVTPALSRGVVKAKGQRLKGMGRQRRRGTAVLSPFKGNPLLEQPLEPVVSTSMSVLSGTTTVVTRPCQQGQHSCGRGPQHVKTGISLLVTAATQRPTGRKGDKTRKKTLLCVLCGRGASHTTSEATHEPGTSTGIHVSTVAPNADEQEESLQISKDRLFATTGAPVMSAMQLSIQRAQRQFDFKKRRKELLFLRQQ